MYEALRVLVGEAAYRALVQVAAGLPGLLLGLPLGLLEVDDLGVRPAAGKAQLHGPEGPGEDEVVDKAGQGQQDAARAGKELSIMYEALRLSTLREGESAYVTEVSAGPAMDRPPAG